MLHRSPLYSDDYKPSFSGHETFPLRYGWLKKAYDAVAAGAADPGNKEIFLGEDAIARFGVGKNMVAAMRHWGACCGVIQEHDNKLATAPIGDFIFGKKGVDRYLEHPASLWLLHWQLCSYNISRPTKTTWFWLFNHYPSLDFQRDDLTEGLLKLADARGWQRVASKTVRNDVDCIIRTYEARQAERESVEDALSSPLSELGLIRGFRGHFQLVRGPKRTLPTGVFIHALLEFWGRYGTTSTLSLEAIAHEPGAPGRVFLLDEADLSERLLGLEDATSGALKWSETAGLKQVLKTRDLAASEVRQILSSAYDRLAEREAA